MKILIWSQYFWPENFRINDLVASLQQRGVQVTVLTGKPNYPEGRVFPGYRAYGMLRERYVGAEVVRVPLVPRGNSSPLRLVLNYLSFIFSGYILAPFALRGYECDVVFVYAPSPLLQALPAVLMARLKRAPLVVWVQDLWPESLAATGMVKNRWVIKGVGALVRYIYRNADSILIQSEAFRESVASLADDPRKIIYHPNAAQPSHDFGVIDPELISEIENCFSVVFAGNLGRAQSLETILSAAECLRQEKEIRLFIVGSGSCEDSLAKEIERRKLANVVLTGRLPNSEMPAVFAAASALLLTLVDSPALALTIPSKLQGYLAAGRPVIACLNGESARIVSDAEAGLTCPAADVEALAAAVLKLHALPSSERDRLGANGRRYFEEHFESSKRLDELIELFQGLSKKRKEKGQ